MPCWRPCAPQLHFCGGCGVGACHSRRAPIFPEAHHDSGRIAGVGTRSNGVCASQSLQTRENGSHSPAAVALGLLGALAGAVMRAISESVLARTSGGVCEAARLSRRNARPNAHGKRVPAPPTAPPPLPAPACGRALPRCAPGERGSHCSPMHPPCASCPSEINICRQM